MGMYDDISTPPVQCPSCGETSASEDWGWQSKDGPCELAILQFWEVDNFYGSCPKCSTWVDAESPRRRVPVDISVYEFT